jgi:ABC-type multidrug transport system fused ATPase/permease subunit
MRSATSPTRPLRPTGMPARSWVLVSPSNRIAVVIDGRVVELGSHHELVERDGHYAALWRAWTS